MKVGVLFTSHPDPKTEPYPHQAVHARVTEEVLEAERQGFDSVWIAEHHFSNRCQTCNQIDQNSRTSTSS